MSKVVALCTVFIGVTVGCASAWAAPVAEKALPAAAKDEPPAHPAQPSGQAKLELWHADFACRIGQKIYVQPGSAGGDQLVAALSSDKGLNQTLCEKSGPLQSEEVFVLKQRDLPAGKYTLTVKILDQAGKVLRDAVETFDKPYDGLPRVGIDENNAICVEGRPFFPICSWGINERDIPTWADRKYVNALCHVGFGPDNFDIEVWKKYLDAAAANNVKVIGPLRGDYWPGRKWRIRYQDEQGKWKRLNRIDLDRLAEYVNATKDHPGLLMWTWHDEPDLGGRDEYIPATEVRRWTDKCHELDPQHPHFINLSGYMYTGNVKREHGRQLAQSYSFMFDDLKTPPMGANEPFARKTHMADALSFDYYPYEYRAKFDWITLEDFATALDNMRQWNHDLVPYLSCVETCDIRAKPTDRPPTPAITAEQLRNLCWINIVHGARGIVWFHHFEPTPPENYKEMTRLVEQVAQLGPAMLGSDYAGKVEVTVPPEARVDVMAKEHGGKVYLFAVSIRKGRNFHEKTGSEFKAKFALEGLAKEAEVAVFDENRRLTAGGGVFQDTFTPTGVHIYVIEKSGRQDKP